MITDVLIPKECRVSHIGDSLVIEKGEAVARFMFCGPEEMEKVSESCLAMAKVLRDRDIEIAEFNKAKED